MRESGSLELDPSVSAAMEPERAATMPLETLRAQTVLQEGMLGRKHDVDGSGKKASNRSWTTLFFVLKPEQLSAYKDLKTYSHGITYHGENPLFLSDASWEILNIYKKKKHICKLRLSDGSEYLFQCKDEEELQRWSQAMQRAFQPLAAEEASGPSGAKTHSLPPPSSSAALPEPSAGKKEKKFSLAGKKK
ncbi:spectrin beta chain, non-erythrocytic 1-like [Notothenia coriiceps]|uniref:Spectrin beta chain, non-erythrocytic 1-like n=1 Tax=Notothenia coriiceps TaxID=8208 RepID=A0A6I9NQA2_9TELE|nr:PREDICTED: spectrin beta chain, non-erythrocytic 1-like [Notothenia coriiceps]